MMLPWRLDSMNGSGVYAMSEKGRASFESFPEVKADDYWVSAQFAPCDRRSVTSAEFTVPGSRTLRQLVRRKSRILAYNRLLDEELATAPGHQRRSGGSDLRRIVSERPTLIPAVVLYAAVSIVTDVLSRSRVRTGSLDWVTDRK